MSLLATKFFIPSLRAEHVPRQVLVEKLEQNLSKPYTLISAPAGFGKTSLVSECLLQSKQQAVWLSLDENDSQAKTFAQYFIGALKQAESSLGNSALALLSNTEVKLESIMTECINDLAKRDKYLVLVLDDYHLIENTAIDKVLTFLVEHSPPSLHLIMTSRVDPSLGSSAK